MTQPQLQQQARFNAGKPKLSYFFANRRALAELVRYFDETPLSFVEDNGPIVEDTIDSVTKFLASGPGTSRLELVWSLKCTLAELQFDLTGKDVDFSDIETMFSSGQEALAEYCAVCEYGERKYARGNYRAGAPITEYLDPALRHTLKYGSGQTNDQESGVHHLAHSLWNQWQALDQPDFRDDRLPPVNQGVPDLSPAAYSRQSSLYNCDEDSDTEELPPPPSDSDAVPVEMFCSCQFRKAERDGLDLESF